MKFIFLDENFQTMGSVGVFTTLLWYRRYYQPGIFELHLSAEYFDLINGSMYLWRNDRPELGVIREVNFARGGKGEKTMYCKGFFSEHLLNNRVIQPVFNKTGVISSLAYDVVDLFAVNPVDAGRKIRGLQITDRPALGTSITLQDTGSNVGDKLYEVLKTQEMSQRIVFDYLKNTLTYQVWQGLDRRDTQNVNSWAIFSDSFRNIKNAQYDRETSEYKNVAYVAGEGEGTARTVVEVDIRSSPDEERRELFVDARDLQRETEEVTYTEAQYKELLRQRGLEKLADYAAIEKVDSGVDPGANLIYGVDFDLGDLCTYRYSDVNLECSKRITEIQEVFEGPSQTLNVIFGTDVPQTLQQVIRKEMK